MFTNETVYNVPLLITGIAMCFQEISTFVLGGPLCAYWQIITQVTRSLYFRPFTHVKVGVAPSNPCSWKMNGERRVKFWYVVGLRCSFQMKYIFHRSMDKSLAFFPLVVICKCIVNIIVCSTLKPQQASKAENLKYCKYLMFFVSYVLVCTLTWKFKIILVCTLHAMYTITTFHFPHSK